MHHPFAAKGPKVSKGRSESPLVASVEAKSPKKQKKESKALSSASHKKPVTCGRFRPPAGGRGTFHHWKVPKGCRGRPKGACLMAAPGPPVAKLQCTASLAGARPARFTSVPGRATVAYGAADPSPGSPAPDYPWSDGRGPLRQGYLVAVRAAAKVPYKVRARYGLRRSSNKGTRPLRRKGAGGIPRPFKGGIGGSRNFPCPLVSGKGLFHSWNCIPSPGAAEASMHT